LGKNERRRVSQKKKKKEKYYIKHGFKLIGIEPEQEIEGLLWLFLGKIKPKGDN